MDPGLNQGLSQVIQEAKVGKWRKLVKKSDGMIGLEGSLALQADKEQGKKKRKKSSMTLSSNGKRSKSRSKRDVNASESELKEMWETVAGPGLENDGEGERTIAHSSGDSHQEEENEIDQLFKRSRKKKKIEISSDEISLAVEYYMAQFEVAAEADAQLNVENQPAVNKLMTLPQLVEILKKKNLQQEFIDHGILTVLRTWLEPLPDGSLPNVNIRTAILEILIDLPIDLTQHVRKEQLKKSGLGKVRPVTKAARLDASDADLDPVALPKAAESLKATSGLPHAVRPDKVPLDFLVRPPSKIDPVKRRAQPAQHGQKVKLEKAFRRMKASNKWNLHSLKPNIDGRGFYNLI
ncbi:hypothetical protein J5N97_006142 [Dioscorea zingiberensis]|uniref:TFIIS N-terminal domain-containing protein n=1 Tax=Dioscorea zingiberensis TaxID=325984 RepID=A0A9D5D9H4_9LILI|nr:hypothetical protein J5N97_006142 [Dioscorea zingiberensis]